MNPLLHASSILAGIVVALGLITAVYAYLVGSVQTDIKSALSFASLAQVGLIVAEIGLGAWIPILWYVALVHLLGHACLRTLQFVRAPSLLQDYRHLEDAIGAGCSGRESCGCACSPGGRRSGSTASPSNAVISTRSSRGSSRRPFVGVFSWFDRLERRWTGLIQPPRKEEPLPQKGPEPQRQTAAAEVRS